MPASQTTSSTVEMPIDLPTVLRLAEADALEVQLAGQRLAEAQARRLAADFQFLPTISPGIVRRWHRDEIQAVDGAFLNVDKQSAQVGVSGAAEWRLGEAVFQSLAARRRVAASVASLQASKDEARLTAVNAFFSLVLARADQAIIEDRIRQADETVRITTAQREAGAGLLSEVRRAEAARAGVRQRLAAAREKVRLASLDLTSALHIDPLVSLTPSQEPQDQLELVPARQSINELVAAALEKRPELAESRARWAACQNDVRAASIGPWIPALRAEAFGGGLGPRPTDTQSSADYAVGLQWNIGRGGIGDVSRTRVARAQQKQEEVRYAQLSDQVSREVIAQQAHVEATREQIALAREEILAAEETLRLSRERMRNGAALTLEVLSAEEVLFGARLRAAQGINEYNKAQYGLLRSIGGWGEGQK